MKRPKARASERRIPYIGAIAPVDAAQRRTTADPGEILSDDTSTDGLPAQRDYFPLSPMIAVAMLWWGLAQPIALSSGAWLLVNTVLSSGLAYVIYRWLCGPGTRAALLGIGLALVFCFAWRRSIDAYNALGLGIYLGLLLLLWLTLKFAGRVHARVRDEDDGPPRMLHDDPRGYLDDFSDYSNYMPVFQRQTATVEEVWTTVSTVFQPRFPASWSARKRRMRYWQATFGGVALIVLGILAANGRGPDLAFLWLTEKELALTLVAAGWAVVTVAYEAHKASNAPAKLALSPTANRG